MDPVQRRQLGAKYYQQIDKVKRDSTKLSLIREYHRLGVYKSVLLQAVTDSFIKKHQAEIDDIFKS